MTFKSGQKQLQLTHMLFSSWLCIVFKGTAGFCTSAGQDEKFLGMNHSIKLTSWSWFEDACLQQILWSSKNCKDPLYSQQPSLEPRKNWMRETQKITKRLLLLQCLSIKKIYSYFRSISDLNNTECVICTAVVDISRGLGLASHHKGRTYRTT